MGPIYESPSVILRTLFLDPLFFMVVCERRILVLPWKLKQNHQYVGALELLYRTQSMGQMIASSQFKTYQKLTLG